MTITAAPAVQIVSVSRELMGDEVARIAGEILSTLYAAADRLGLSPSGPFTLIYQGFTSPDRAFTVEFALPVAGEPKAASEPETGTAVRTTRPFRCLSEVHYGPMTTILDTWQALNAEVAKGGYVVTGESREIFTKFIDFESVENITEIQIGMES